MKSGFVSIVGRTNAGKSTLVNALCGEKIAIVSNKPQTTRFRIMGVLNDDECQIVFTDTPGLHKPQTRLGDFMIAQANESLVDTDLVLLVIEPVDNVGAAEEKIAKSMNKLKIPAILVINKIDTIKKEKLFSIIDKYKDIYDFDAVYPISAKNGDGVSELLNEIKKYLQEGPQYFPDDMVTDLPLKQRIAEAVREKMLYVLDKEVPHGIAIEVTIREENEKIIKLDVTVYCEKESHKGIIIGKGGKLLKKIGSEARTDVEKIVGKQVYLEVWVKVKEGWRDNNFLLKNFGFSE